MRQRKPRKHIVLFLHVDQAAADAVAIGGAGSLDRFKIVLHTFMDQGQVRKIIRVDMDPFIV